MRTDWTYITSICVHLRQSADNNSSWFRLLQCGGFHFSVPTSLYWVLAGAALGMSMAANLAVGADPYTKAATWPQTVAETAKALGNQNGDAVESARIATKRDFTAVTNSFFPKSDSFAQWLAERTPAYNTDALERVFAGLDNAAQPYEKRMHELLAARTDARDLAWLQLYQDAYDALRKQCVARTPLIAFVQRAPNSRRGTNAIMFATRPHPVGSAICVWNPAHPQEKARRIFENPEGYIFDLNPSYDGRRLVFGYKETQTVPYHVWEIGSDGAGMRQITSGSDCHDFNPVYYPDGRIVFASSRVRSYSLCQDFLASALYVCNADGGNIRRFDFTTLCTMTPAVLPDGSIVCTRWEYNDKNIFAWQGLWTIYPNGKQLKLYYGNTLTVPNSRYGPKPIPGTGKVMITMAGHHHPPVADLAVVDRSLGVENPEGCRQITFETECRVTAGKTWRDTNWHSGDRFYPWAYADPFPLDPELSMVAYGGPAPDEGGPGRFRLFLLTDRGVLFDLYGETDHSFACPVPLNARPLPAAVPGEVPTEAGEGTFFVQDVYQGLTSQGVKRGEVKALRVMQQIPKKYNTEGRRYRDHYPVVGFGSYYVKSDLGTVPVDESGAAYFKAPSHVELFFEAIDRDGKAISRMGSVTQITTGETVSCIGCHENRLAPPLVARDRMALRLQRPPDFIQPPPWGAGNVNYVQQVQPVLDRYCIRCHSGAKPAGIDLSGDKTRFFNMSYENLVQGPFVDYYWINAGPTGNFPALRAGSMVSPLTKLIEEKHQGVDVDDAGRRRIYAWIDANAPYYGTWEMSRPHTMGGRDTWADRHEFLPWMNKVREIVEKRGIPKFAFHENSINVKGDRVHLMINLTHPQWSRLLTENLAEAAGGLAPNGRAILKSTDDPDYKALLAAIEEGKRLLLEKPRMDMPGAVPIPQDRNFGRVF